MNPTAIASLDNTIEPSPWVLLRPNGDIRSTYVRFTPGGRIVGYEHVNEANWGMENDRLVFRHSQGFVTARSGEVTVDPKGLHRILMMREDNAKLVAHILVERKPVFDALECDTMSALWQGLSTHPAFPDGLLTGRDGFSKPAFSAPEIIEVKPSTLPRLFAMGIMVAGPIGSRNTVVVDSLAAKIEVVLQFNNTSCNVVVLDPHCRLRGSLTFEADQNVAIIGNAFTNRDIHVTAMFRYGAAGLVIGCGSSAGHINTWIEGPGRSIQIGDDFMSSWGVWLRTADSHGIVDLASGQVINPSKSIVVGPHVWLGQDAIIMPGTTIGGGSIVGAKSVVTKSLPACSVGAGVPARVVRRNASWTRQAHPSPDEIAGLQARSFADAFL